MISTDQASCQTTRVVHLPENVGQPYYVDPVGRSSSSRFLFAHWQTKVRSRAGSSLDDQDTLGKAMGCDVEMKTLVFREGVKFQHKQLLLEDKSIHNLR